MVTSGICQNHMQGAHVDPHDVEDQHMTKKTLEEPEKEVAHLLCLVVCISYLKGQIMSYKLGHS